MLAYSGIAADRLGDAGYLGDFGEAEQTNGDVADCGRDLDRSRRDRFASSAQAGSRSQCIDSMAPHWPRAIPATAAALMRSASRLVRACATSLLISWPPRS